MFEFSIIYLLGTFCYLEPFLRYRGPKKQEKQPPPLILGKYYPDFAIQGRLSVPSQGNIF